MTLFVELTATRFAPAPNTALTAGALAAVVHRRRGAVRVQVVDLVEPRAGVAERLPHRLDRPVARWMRVGDAIARQRVAVARELGVDARAAPARRLPIPRARGSPAPSPSTKPLRVASNGRLARSGVSLSGDTAYSRQNPPRPTGLIIESKPPASTRSAAPRRISFIAVPTRLTAGRARGVHRRRVAADAEAAQQQRDARGGLAAAEHHRVGRRALGRERGGRCRARRRAPRGAARPRDRRRRRPSCRCRRRSPSAPRRSRLGRIPASRTACSAAASAKRCERFANLRSLRSSIARSRSKPFTSAAMRTGKPLASNRLIGATPLLAGEQGAPRRRDVKADRSHETEPGDRDPASRSRSWRGSARRSRPARSRPSCHSMRAARLARSRSLRLAAAARSGSRPLGRAG